MKLANDIGQAGGDPSGLRQEILSAESRALQDLQNEYNGANKKNESELKALQDRTQQFKSNANKPQYVDPLLSSIDKTIVAAKTPNPPPNVSGDGSSGGGNPSGTVSLTADQDKITRLLDSYAQAFERKDQIQLRHVWPTLTDKQFKDNVDALKGAESIHVTIQKSSITVSGVTAVANCTQTTEVKTQGRVQRFSSTAIFSLRKLGMENGDWVIERVSFEKIR
jgi:hypothetical protein